MTKTNPSHKGPKKRPKGKIGKGWPRRQGERSAMCMCVSEILRPSFGAERICEMTRLTSRKSVKLLLRGP